MVTFSGRLGRARFLGATALRIGLFVLSVLGFPWLLQGVVVLSNCRGIGGACGAMGLVVATAVKPLVAALFIFAFAGISVRRARDAGLPGIVGLAVPILLLLDHQLLTVLGAPWSLGFTMGVLSPYWPRFLLAALACIAVLALMPPRERNEPAAPGPFDLPPPSRWLALAALALAILSVALGLPREASGAMLPITLLMGATTILLPTFALYLWTIWAATALVRKPGLVAAGALALGLLPFGHWAYAHRLSAQDRAREAAEIAAVPTIKPAAVPSVLVFESRSSTGLRAAWTVPGLDRVVAKGAYGSLVEFTRAAPRKAGGPTRIDGLPGDYLLLKVGRDSAFARKGQIYGVSGGPYELRMVQGGSDELVAVWYEAFRPAPSRWPVLTLGGWHRGGNSASTDEIQAGIERFLARALGVTRTVEAGAERKG